MNDEKGLLAALWPAVQGTLRCVAAQRTSAKGAKYWRNYFTEGNVRAQALIDRLDADPSVSGVYHACALYNKDMVEALQANDKEQKQRNWSNVGRVAAAVEGAFALWCDMDVGTKPSEYATLANAKQALQQVAREWLRPSFVVASGGGLHAYWVTQELLPPSEWMLLATGLKAKLQLLGVKFDPTRACDMASVLRPPGSTNRKHGAPVTVRVHDTGVRYTRLEFESSLVGLSDSDALASMPVSMPPAPLHVLAASRVANTDLISSAHEPSFVRPVAKHCRQIGGSIVRKGAGDREPLWLDVLRTLTKCVDVKDDLLHHISSGHEGYDRDDTAAKIAHAKTLSTATCASIEANNPGGCSGCPHHGRGTFSPIRLGEPGFFGAPAAAPPPTPQAYSIPPEVAEGQMYRFDVDYSSKRPHMRYQTKIKDEHGKWVWSGDWVPLSTTLYRPSRLERDAETGEHVAVYEFTEPSGREFEGRTATGVVSEARGLFGFLAQHGVVIMSYEKEQRMAHQALNKRWIESLKQRAPSRVTHQQFGWMRGRDLTLQSFVAGYHYGVDGSVNAPSLTGNAAVLADKVRPRGTLDEWKNVANIFMRPGLEVQQFCLMLGLFGPFAAAADASDGFAAVALVSSRGGQGKTTAARLAVSAWMHPSTQASQSDTANARAEMLAAAHNLPFLLDEMTMAAASDLANLLYSVGNQATRGRLTKDATMRTPKQVRLPLFITSNSSIRELVQQALQSTDQAVNTRFLQLSMVKDPTLEYKLADGEAMEKLANNYGTAGDWWARYMLGAYDGTKHLDAFLTEMTQIRTALRQASDSPATQRFYTFSAAAAVAGARWCQRAGFLNVNSVALERWVTDVLLPSQTTQLVDAEVDKVQLLADFVADNAAYTVDAVIKRPMTHATETTIPIKWKRDRTRHCELVSVHPTPGDYAQRRMVIRWEKFINVSPGGKTFDGETRLIVSRAAFREYLAKHNCDLSAFIEDARSVDLIMDLYGSDNRTRLTPGKRRLHPIARGVQYNAAKVEVLVFDPSKSAALAQHAEGAADRLDPANELAHPPLRNADLPFNHGA